MDQLTSFVTYRQRGGLTSINWATPQIPQSSAKPELGDIDPEDIPGPAGLAGLKRPICIVPRVEFWRTRNRKISLPLAPPVLGAIHGVLVAPPVLGALQGVLVAPPVLGALQGVLVAPPVLGALHGVLVAPPVLGALHGVLVAPPVLGAPGVLLVHPVLGAPWLLLGFFWHLQCWVLLGFFWYTQCWVFLGCSWGSSGTSSVVLGAPNVLLLLMKSTSLLSLYLYVSYHGIGLQLVWSLLMKYITCPPSL